MGACRGIEGGDCGGNFLNGALAGGGGVGKCYLGLFSCFEVLGWEEMYTYAPCLASSRAMLAPMPREAPVTMAIFPARDIGIGLIEEYF